MDHIMPPRTSYIFSKRPGYMWIIGTIELGLGDSRIDEADLTHTYTPSSNSENV
ncbi:hypothetical protein SMMN14_05904, partial [Sphaerulina musiva]